MRNLEKIGIKPGSDTNEQVLTKIKQYYKKPVKHETAIWYFDGVSDAVLKVKVLDREPKYFIYSKEFAIFEMDKKGQVFYRAYFS